LAVYFNHFDRRNGAKHVIVVVEYFILVEWVVCGGIMHFLVVDGGKGNYPKYIYIYITFVKLLNITTTMSRSYISHQDRIYNPLV